MATTDSGSMTHTEDLAIGTRGFLIRGMGDEMWFRVYNPDKSFTDYEITHHDCEVVIIDPSAAFIKSEAGEFLDYTAESMRITK